MAKREVPITYRKSFMAKYILSDERCKEVYGILKNKILSIKGMKSRTSWFYDAFNVGRINFAKLSVRGKYVSLYLNIDPNNYPENIYHQEDVSDRRRYKETRFKMHVKSDRTIKYAFRLIEEEANIFNLTLGDLPNTSYYLPYRNEEELINEGLIALDEKSNKKPERLTYKSEEFIEVDNYVKQDTEQKDKPKIVYVDGSKVFIKEKKSFEAKLIKSDSQTQKFYSEIKNRMLSFRDVKSRISWKYDAFSKAKVKLAKLQIRGKYLCLFLALDTAKHNMSKEGLENASKYSLLQDTPVMIRIKNEERMEKAKELIEELRKRFLLEEGFVKENHDFSKDYANVNGLESKGLIKIYKKFDEKSEIDEVANDDEDTKRDNFQVFKTENRLVLTIDANNEFVESFEPIKIPLEGERDTVFLDVIQQNYKDGDTVTLDSLKDKKLIGEENVFYKVAFRGGEFNIKVHIIASCFSKIAEKVILESGSTFETDVK